MNIYDEMYRKFNMDEEQKKKYLVMAAAFQKKNTFTRLLIETVVNDRGKEKIERKETINAKLV